MDPTEFLSTARQLVATGSEGAYRSAVSRAYYGALHVCNGLVPAEFAPSQAEMHSDGSHNAIIGAMERWGRSLGAGRTDAQMAAKKIAQLKRWRVVADYRIKQTWDIDAEKWVSVAEEISRLVVAARSKRDGQAASTAS